MEKGGVSGREKDATWIVKFGGRTGMGESKGDNGRRKGGFCVGKLGRERKVKAILIQGSVTDQQGTVRGGEEVGGKGWSVIGRQS